MNTETLQINIESPIATVTLNRPNVLNAFNEQLVLDLQQAFKSLTEDESVRVIILTGSGKGFSAGADLTEREASWDPDCPSKDALLRGYMPIFNDIVEILKKILKSEKETEYFDNPYSFYQNLTQADISNTKLKLKYNPEFTLEKGITDYFI